MPWDGAGVLGQQHVTPCLRLSVEDKKQVGIYRNFREVYILKKSNFLDNQAPLQCFELQIKSPLKT